MTTKVKENHDFVELYSPGGSKKFSIYKPKIPIKTFGTEKYKELTII